MKDGNIRLRMVVEVEYAPNGETEAALKERLSRIVQDAAGDGHMTGDGPATVEEWSAKVKRI